MNDPAITAVGVVELTDEADGLYVFGDDEDATRFAAAAEMAGRTCVQSSEPIFFAPHLVDDLVTTVADDAEWPESLIGLRVEDAKGRRFAALSVDTKDGRPTVGDDTEWEYADLVRVVDTPPTDPETAYTVVGQFQADRRPYVVTVYTHSGPSAAINLAERCCAEEQGVADPGLRVFAVFRGEPAYTDLPD
jgi:hypothetical protein